MKRMGRSHEMTTGAKGRAQAPLSSTLRRVWMGISRDPTATLSGSIDYAQRRVWAWTLLRVLSTRCFGDERSWRGLVTYS
jgi:hypothetical protein